MNRIVLFALSALLHFYVGWRLIPSLAEWPGAAWALVITLMLSYVLMHLGLHFRRRTSRFTDYLS